MYLLAGAFAAISIPLWVAQYAGALSPGTAYGGSLWHAHEMIFGFAAAVIVGFLFTAGRNWSGRPTPSGAALAAIAALWLAARAARVHAVAVDRGALRRRVRAGGGRGPRHRAVARAQCAQLFLRRAARGDGRAQRGIPPRPRRAHRRGPLAAPGDRARRRALHLRRDGGARRSDVHQQRGAGCRRAAHRLARAALPGFGSRARGRRRGGRAGRRHRGRRGRGGDRARGAARALASVAHARESDPVDPACGVRLGAGAPRAARRRRSASRPWASRATHSPSASSAVSRSA